MELHRCLCVWTARLIVACSARRQLPPTLPSSHPRSLDGPLPLSLPSLPEGNVPLLAYWASRLPDGGNHPAALPVLLQLLAAGADPLRCDPSPPLHQPEVTTRGVLELCPKAGCGRGGLFGARCACSPNAHLLQLQLLPVCLPAHCMPAHCMRPNWTPAHQPLPPTSPSRRPLRHLLLLPAHLRLPHAAGRGRAARAAPVRR